MSGGRGPKSICLRTWSIARSPLNAAFPVGDDGIAGRELVEALARGRGGGSSFGQAAKSGGIANKIARRSLRLPEPESLLMLLVFFCCLRCAFAIHKLIKRL